MFLSRKKEEEEEEERKKGRKNHKNVRIQHIEAFENGTRLLVTRSSFSEENFYRKVLDAAASAVLWVFYR